MAGCAEEDSGSEEGPARPLPRPAAAGKVVRVLTVLAYLLSVSLAAILLSVYYVYVWQSPDLPPEPGAAARRSDHHHHARLALQDLPEHRFNDDGGGNSTMRTNYTQESPYNETVSDNRSDDASTDQPAAAPPRSSTDTT